MLHLIEPIVVENYTRLPDLVVSIETAITATVRARIKLAEGEVDSYVQVNDVPMAPQAAPDGAGQMSDIQRLLALAHPTAVGAVRGATPSPVHDTSQEQHPTAVQTYAALCQLELSTIANDWACDGRWRSRWTLAGGCFELEACSPAGTTQTVAWGGFPSSRQQQVEAVQRRLCYPEGAMELMWHAAKGGDAVAVAVLDGDAALLRAVVQELGRESLLIHMSLEMLAETSMLERIKRGARRGHILIWDLPQDLGEQEEACLRAIIQPPGDGQGASRSFFRCATERQAAQLAEMGCPVVTIPPERLDRLAACLFASSRVDLMADGKLCATMAAVVHECYSAGGEAMMRSERDTLTAICTRMAQSIPHGDEGGKMECFQAALYAELAMRCPPEWFHRVFRPAMARCLGEENGSLKDTSMRRTAFLHQELAQGRAVMVAAEPEAVNGEIERLTELGGTAVALTDPCATLPASTWWGVSASTDEEETTAAMEAMTRLQTEGVRPLNKHRKGPQEGPGWMMVASPTLLEKMAWLAAAGSVGDWSTCGRQREVREALTGSLVYMHES